MRAPGHPGNSCVRFFSNGTAYFSCEPVPLLLLMIAVSVAGAVIAGAAIVYFFYLLRKLCSNNSSTGLGTTANVPVESQAALAIGS